MKRIIYSLMVLGTILVGCNPLEDINNEIKTQDEGVLGIAEYTLKSDDYTKTVAKGGLGLTFTSFNSEADAKSLLPAFLTGKYPYFGNGSSVLVGYNLYIGNAEGVSSYTGATVYPLTNADYASTGSDAFGFYPNVVPSSKIPTVLAAKIAAPTEGKIVLATYKQYVSTPTVGLANLFEYNFTSDLQGWTPVEEFGAQAVWTTGSGYVQGNGFVSGTGAVKNIEWLVSPSINLTGKSNLKFQIAHALKYATNASLLKIMVSENYTGNATTATWTQINLATAPGVDDFTTLSEDYDFSAFDGKTINIALKYESTDTDAGRWRVSKLAIKTLGVTGATESKGEYFVYTSGSWKKATGVYYLNSDDYNAMGTGSGQPGQYDNFSSSVPADNYVPTFLGLKYPFAQQDNKIIVIYKYFSSTSGSTQTRGNLYTYLTGKWTPYQSTIATTLQFGVENGVFIPDNTIRYSLTNADYEYMGNTLTSDPVYSGIVSTLINYHDYDSKWSQTQIVYSLGILLNHIAPNAADGQKYLMSYLVYSGGIAEFSVLLIKEGGVWKLK